MKYELLQNLNIAHTECLVIGLLEDASFPEQIQNVDKQFNKLIHRLHAKLQTIGQIRMQSDVDGQAIMVINCGKKQAYNAETLEKQLKTSVQQLLAQQYTQATFVFPDLLKHTPDQQIEMMVQVIDKACYVQGKFKSKSKPASLKEITLFHPTASSKSLDNGVIIAEAVKFARQLADLPANHCTPRMMSKEVEEIAKSVEHLQCKTHHKKEIEALGMGGLLAVSQGSIEPPCFIEMNYQGHASSAPIVLVGKGVTFDAGGISLKPPPNMNEMKYDMAGAASVVAATLACAKLKLPINVIALLPCTENLPSGQAIKPGDVITMMSKQTVEVLNTDAEGRLILADALTYAERFDPKYVIDVATLTGAVIVALGHVTTGLMANDDELANQLLQAAEQSLDKAWRLPLSSAYEDGLESPVADMINAGFERSAGSILAGMFLSKYTKAYSWAHLDVAGTAWVSGSKRVSTGRPVPLLVEFLRHVSHTR
jgi:leucyl aminopeptidase